MSNLQEVKAQVLDKVEEKVEKLQREDSLDLPKNYSANNALKQAWLELQATKDKNGKPVLEACSKTSVYNAMLDTVVQGLNPGKDQVYYIAYGKTLTAQRSYFGNMALAKRVANVKEVHAAAVYEGDEVEVRVENGRQVVAEHDQNFANIDDDKIVGAYAVVDFEDERPDRYVIMNIEELRQAWRQGKSYKKGGKGPHSRFTGEMSKKTVINRALKPLINGSSDDHLFLSSNRSAVDRAAEEREEEIEEAEDEVIDIAAEGEDTEEEKEESSLFAGQR
ncbi:MAG: recombinase RecT [Candidatus Acetothermia bacterium]